MAEAGASWASCRVSPGSGRRTEVGLVSVGNAGAGACVFSLSFLLFLLYVYIALIL